MVCILETIYDNYNIIGVLNVQRCKINISNTPKYKANCSLISIVFLFSLEKTMYRYLFKKVSSIIPKISNTELIALKSGGVSIDSDILKGKVNIQRLGSIHPMNDLEKKINSGI